MAETASYPSSITAQLFNAVARLSTTITADITNSTTPIPVASSTGFPTAGFITIDNETIYYSGTTALSLGSTACTRGYAGTAIAHLSGASVKYSIVAATINRIQAEIVAIQTYAGTSGGTQGFVNAGYLGGKTIGLLKENAIEFTPTAFDLNNNNPATLLTITGTSVTPKIDKVYFGNTDAADLSAFKMPKTYDGSSITATFLYCSSTASSVFDIGLQSAIAGSGDAYNPTLGTAVYLGAITCSGTTGIQGFTSKVIAGVSLGLTHSKMNYIRVIGGTTCSVQILNTGITWNK